MNQINSLLCNIHHAVCDTAPQNEWLSPLVWYEYRHVCSPAAEKEMQDLTGLIKFVSVLQTSTTDKFCITFKLFKEEKYINQAT